MTINYQELISKHFTYHEALWLPSWNRYATEADGLNEPIIANLRFLFGKMDPIREYFDNAIIVHVAYRPPAYNVLIKGAPQSAHLAEWPDIAAVDFHIDRWSCDEARKKILQDGLLERWKLRMEDNGFGAPWIHLDTKPVMPGHSRYFKP